MSLTDAQAAQLAEVHLLLTQGLRAGPSQTAGGGVPIAYLPKAFYTLTNQITALAGADPVDEAAIARQVLAGLTPAGIAEAVVAALPPELAAQVVTELGTRIRA